MQARRCDDLCLNYLTAASGSSESRFAVAMFWSDSRRWNADASVFANETAFALAVRAGKSRVSSRVRPASLALASVRF